MKKLMTVFIMMVVLVASQAMGATCTERVGDRVTQYKIDDPGNASGYDNHLLYVATYVPRGVVQKSSVNLETYRELFDCNDAVECPWDDLDPPNEVWRSPTFMFLDSIWIANGGCIRGAPLTATQNKNIRIAYWDAYMIKGSVNDILAELAILGDNDLQKTRKLRAFYFGMGVDFTTADTVASAKVEGQEIDWGEYGLTQVPDRSIRWAKIGGGTGWWEFD